MKLVFREIKLIMSQNLYTRLKNIPRNRPHFKRNESCVIMLFEQLFTFSSPRGITLI